MKIGLFGGSFDPIHWGHIRPVLEAVEQAGLDRVIYLPTGRPPHKPNRRLAPALARYAMTELALLEHDRLFVSAHEISEAAPTYTVDTLRHFTEAYPEDELHLVIGADSFAELGTWVRCEEILDLARLVVLSRPGVEATVINAGAASTRPVVPPDRLQRIENRPVEVSSTEVRSLLARGERPPGGWVPDPVVDFAFKYRLYR